MAASPKVQEPSMEEILASIRRIMADDEQPAPQAEPPQRRGEPQQSGDGRPGRPPESRGVSQRAIPGEPPPVPRRAPPHRDGPPAAASYPAAPRAVPRPGGVARPRPENSVSGPPARPPRPWLDEQDEAVFAEAAAVLRQARQEQLATPEPQRGAARPLRAAPQPTYPDQGGEEVSDRHEEATQAPRPMRPQAAPPAFDEPLAHHPQVGQRPESVRRRDLLSPDSDAAVTAAFRTLGDVVLPQKERTVEDLVKEILRPMLKDWLDANLPAIVEDLVRAEIERVARRPR